MFRLGTAEFSALTNVVTVSRNDIQRTRLFAFIQMNSSSQLHSPTSECTLLPQELLEMRSEKVYKGNTSEQNGQQVG